MGGFRRNRQRDRSLLAICGLEDDQENEVPDPADLRQPGKGKPAPFRSVMIHDRAVTLCFR